MARRRQDGNFAEGSVLGRILQIALPMSVALVVNMLYNVVDRIYIGRMPEVGGLALTGVGLAFPLTMMISAFQSLCSTGGGPIFSIARGRGDRAEAERALGNSYLMLLTLGVGLMLVGYAVKAPVLRLTGADDSTFGYADAYLKVYLLGTPFVMTSLGMNTFINGQGASRTGMFTVIIGAAVNFVLDPVFIYVLDMGVTGAALASVIAQGCSCLWTHSFFLGKRAEYGLKLRYMRPDLRLMGRILALGVTGFIAQVTSSAVTMIYNAQLSAMGGTVWVTVMTVLSSVRELMLMPVSGFTSGAQPVLSYNYGAERSDRVREAIRITTAFTFVYTLVVWALLMGLPEVFIRLFNGDPLVLENGRLGMRLFFCLTMFFSLQMSGQCTFSALGKTRYAVFFSLFRKVVLVIPLALILPHIGGLGVKGVFLSEPVSDVIGGGMCYLIMYLTIYRRLGKESAVR